MAILHRDQPCPACGLHHHFADPCPDDRPAARYEAVCPETGRRVEVRPGEPAEEVGSPPQGAVRLEPAGDDGRQA